MKTLDVSGEIPSVQDLLELASDENIILRTPQGREFVLAEVDDFDREVELIRQNDELMEFLKLRSSEAKTLTLSEVREKSAVGEPVFGGDPVNRAVVLKGVALNKEEPPIPAEGILLKAMELAWKDHHHARDQTWKTVQMVAVLGAGLLTIDLQYKSLLATALSAVLVVLAGMVGVGITWNHRKLERRKFIHLMNCEDLLGLHTNNIIPLYRGDDWAKEQTDEVRDGAVSLPRKYSLLDIINPFKQNTSLFILRIHLAIIAFALLIVILRWRIKTD